MADAEAPERSEPQKGLRRRRRVVWLWLALVVAVAAAVGGTIGTSLGLRQSGPLTGQATASARPTIVVATAVAGVSVKGAPSPAATPRVVPRATPAPGSTQYVVQPGDTLRSIAQAHYGDAELWPRIYDANREVIGADPDALKAGTTLEVPPQ